MINRDVIIEAKEAMIADNDGNPQDWMPLLEFRRENRMFICLLPEARPFGGELALGIIGFNPDRVIAIAEGFVKHLPIDGHLEVKRGDLQREFDEDPGADVQRVISAYAFDFKTNDTQNLMLPYGYAEREGGGVTVTWHEEPSTRPESVGGALPLIVQSAHQFVASKPPPEEDMESRIEATCEALSILGCRIAELRHG